MKEGGGIPRAGSDSVGFVALRVIRFVASYGAGENHHNNVDRKRKKGDCTGHNQEGREVEPAELLGSLGLRFLCWAVRSDASTAVTVSPSIRGGGSFGTSTKDRNAVLVGEALSRCRSSIDAW
jgi:hypothetical protein